jgi:hypothetical protein
MLAQPHGNTNDSNRSTQRGQSCAGFHGHEILENKYVTLSGVYFAGIYLF